MTTKSPYSDWRRSWPRVITHHETGPAVDFLRRYYGQTQTGVLRYSGARFEAMASLNTDPYALGPEDFLAVSMLSVNVPAKAAIRLLGPDADVVGELLRRVPINTDIVDVPAVDLEAGSPAAQLWGVLRAGRDGLGPTTTSKLLAAKRPRLLPIWDSFVRRATGMETLGYWAKVQYVLNDDHRMLWHWLGELRSLVTALPPRVSELRILDVLLWMSIAGSTVAPDPASPKADSD